MAPLDLPQKPLLDDAPQIRRLNRLPIFVAILLAVMFFAVIIYGLSSRGLRFGDEGIGSASNSPPASDFADRLKRGVGDGVIDAPAEPIVFRPEPAPAQQPAANPFRPAPATAPAPAEQVREELEPEHIWRARLRREHEEQYIREQQRQRMARLQADDAAYDSPIAVQIDKTNAGGQEPQGPGGGQPVDSNRGPDLATALRAGLAGQTDANGQSSKQEFFNQDLKDLGYLPNQVVGQVSPFELKRGSVIPASLISGINSDLPGRITAQVSQSVYDSATGRHLLIPQGSKLFGRYDSDVTFGQKRVLVIWTDIIFPNGSTLQIGGMAGADAAGFGGFKDRVNNHYLRIFGSAALVAAIGAGIDMAVPQDRSALNTSAARRSFAETFGRVAERTISKNIDVQPTLEIRPGYRFNILVDQDIVFPGRYGTS